LGKYKCDYEEIEKRGRIGSNIDDGGLEVCVGLAIGVIGVPLVTERESRLNYPKEVDGMSEWYQKRFPLPQIE
jgi:hypothetical protein